MKKTIQHSLLAVAFLLAAFSQKLQAYPITAAVNSELSPIGNNMADYCLSYSNFPWEDWVAKVELADLAKTSGKSVYSNFTGQTANVTAGQSYPVALTTGFSYFTWDEYWRIWIDLNHDNDFEDAGEMVYQGILGKPANGTPAAALNGNLTIPATALAGPTRMRVTMKRGAYATPCEVIPFGEIEDYTVNIQGGPVELANLYFPYFELIPGSLFSCYVLPGVPFTGGAGGGVVNNGTVPAGSFNLYGYFSKDQQYSPEDVLWKSFSFNGLAPNDFAGFDFGGVMVPASLPLGKYYVVLVLDPENNVVETNESDNLYVSQAVNNGAPDFTVSSATGIPATTIAGSSLNLPVETTNLFAFPLAQLTGTLEAKVYLSVDEQNNSPIYGGGDLEIGTVAIPFNQFSNAPLYLNGKATVHVPAIIPGNTAAGNYFIFVQIGGACERSIQNNASNFFPIQITTGTPGTYCSSVSNFPWEDWIAAVQIGTQEKTSGKSPYSDFSSTFNFNLSQGSNAVKLTGGFSYFGFEEYWRIWIDFNRDDDFTDPGELVLSAVMPKGPDGSATQSLTQTVNIPAVSLPGATRMRVVMKRGAFASPCENIPFGEIEDYSVNVATQGGACKKDIGAGEILCISNAPATGQYYLFAANQGTQTRYTLNREGEVLGQTSAPIVPEDSTLVQGNQVVRKLSNGTIAWQKTITASVLSKFPTIEKAVELNDGTFILGGFQRYYSGGVLTADSLVLIKTDAALNYLSYVRVEHYSGDLKDDKLLGLEKTQSGKVLAIYQTSYTFFAKTYYLRLSQYSPQLQVLKTWATDYVGNLIWKRTPCGLHLFKYGYYNVGPKSQSGGTFSFLFDLETLTFKTNRNSETGSVSYTGSYSRESYTSALFADSISAYYFIAPNVMHLEPFSVRLFRPNGTYFEKRPALIEFDHIFKTGDTTMLFVGSTNGQLWALNPDCGSPGTKQPDLSMANLTLQSTTTSPGAVLWFNFDLKNTGNAPATGEYVIAAYLSTDNQLSADDRVTGYINTGNTPVGTIPGVLGGITVPAEQPAGTYYLILKVDITGTILELNENNNLLVAANAFNVAVGTAETCGFQTSISSDGFSTYGAASINGHHVFRMSSYDEGSNTTLLRNNTLDNNGVVTSTENFSLPEKVTALADENFLCATTADPNVIYLKKLNKAGTALWVKQFFVLNAISVGEVSISEAVNGDILLTGVFVESWYPTYLHKVFYIRADYNGNLIYRNDFAVTPNDEPYLTARFFTGYNQSIYIVVEKPSYIGQKKPYLLKIAGQSNSLLWQKEFYDFTQIRGIAETSGDATLVTTFHPGAPGGAPNSYGNLYKIDAAGNEVFNKNIALLAPAIPPGASYGPVGDIGPIVRGTDGGYITGFTRFFPYTQVPSQSIVIRMNSSLDTLWTRIFNSPDNGLFKTFRAVPGGAFLGTRELTGGPQVNLVKISANGQVSPCAPPASYCQSQSNFPWEDWIARVQVNTLDNSSGKSPYSDFTALYTTLQKDLDYDITLNTGFSYFTWPEYWNVWIDYNHDGVFTEPGELAFSKILSAPAAGTPLASVSGTFKLPASALTGPTRMRITMKRNGDPTPCENLAFGEIEDYTVNIVNNFGGSTGDRAANLSFEAVRNKTWVQLNGLFHSTEAVAEVIMEKSPDGISYEILESEPGQLQPDAVESMRVLDKSPLDGFNFYRMRVLLENGTVLYSPVRIVSFDVPFDFTIFPNPASAGIFIQLEEPPTAEMTWTVYDAFGRPVWSQDILPDATFPYQVEVQDFEEGMYYLYAQRSGQRAVGRRFVIVR